MRVHALAKLLGVTSKAVVAELAKLGAEVRSVQSSIDKELAEQVRIALAAPADATPPEPTTSPDPSPDATPALGGPLFLQPEAVTPPPRRRASRPAAAPEPQEIPAEPAVEDATATPAPDEAAEDDEDAPKRRRRGRRGRGRGRGQQGDDENPSEGTQDGDTGDASPAAAQATEDTDTSSTNTAGTDADATTEDEPGTDDSDQSAETSTGSRRRRRRRRKSGSGSEAADDDSAENREDDPPNTVVHEREARSRGKSAKGQGAKGQGGKDQGGKDQGTDNAGDQVQGITGSTRLEAKRQRRRDGRDAGRRRPPILSESEFLARREAVSRKMVVRQRGQQTQVAVLEDDVLVEHFVTSSSSTAMVGNIYLGRVQNVLPSMEAAFIDVGRGRNGVLYAGEVDWDAAGLGGKARKIEQALHSGDSVLVQVSKDPVGHKGARLTTQISLPGRFLVYVPGGGSAGISRKLPDTERKRLKEILKRIVPADAGVIIRTASEGVSEEELERDVSRLQDQWEAISAKAEQAKSAKSSNPVALYEEPDLLVKVVRDQFNEDFSSLVVAGDQVWETVQGYVNGVAPELMARLERYESDVDVFTTYRIDEQLAKAMDRKVWLPSGGTLVIDRTEAMTVVDVNTGKFTGAGGNLEETVTRNNLEAAEEIVRQMRLRDIGGMIVVDFIDMVLESNRDLVLRRLTECLGRDRTRHQVSEVTSLGLVQMTRKRMGAGLIEEFSTPCEHCHGRGVLVQDEPVAPSDQDNAQSHGESSRRSRRPRGDAPMKVEPVKEPWPAALIPASSAAAQAAAQAAAAQAVTPQPEAPQLDSPEQAGSRPDYAPASVAPTAEAPTETAVPPRTRSRRASRPAAAPSAASGDAGAVAAPTIKPVIVESEASPAPEPQTVEEAQTVPPEQAPRKARARRASRPTA
ncbi:MAG: translation initiation factor IF-2 N-terminal domain-containing protein, partial [Actinomycetota bacterium]|nr:translation initiation factor IF-2 N-terminal domain-containing protein [Actinomycetota bacterium]